MTNPKTHAKRHDLYEALADLRSPAECQKFFLDLCTPAELDSMADRWNVAKLLAQNIPYRAIHEQTGTSTATVTRVARALSDGEGYRFLLNRQLQKKPIDKKFSAKPIALQKLTEKRMPEVKK
jgi:TrpR-related protein YerC/YecD